MVQQRKRMREDEEGSGRVGGKREGFWFAAMRRVPSAGLGENLGSCRSYLRRKMPVDGGKSCGIQRETRTLKILAKKGVREGKKRGENWSRRAEGKLKRVAEG